MKLRPLTIDDAQGYLETMLDKDTIKNLETTPKTLEEVKEEIEQNLKQVEEKDSEYLTIEVEGKYAGNIILQHQDWDPENDEGRLHLWIHPDYRKKGLATEAVKEALNHGFKKFSKIFAQCKAHNQGVIKILKKSGFSEVKRHTTDHGEKILWAIKLK